MDFLYYLPVLFFMLIAYSSGVLTVFLWQWLERRSLHTQNQTDSEEGYTLTLIERPGDLSEGE